MLNGDWRVNRSPSMLPSSKSALLQRLRLLVLTMLGGICVHCGYSDVRALQIDHKKGTGYKERRKYRGTSLYYYFIRRIKARSKAYQVLCANCNCIKRGERREFRYWYKKGTLIPLKGKS